MHVCGNISWDRGSSKRKLWVRNMLEVFEDLKRGQRKWNRVSKQLLIRIIFSYANRKHIYSNLISRTSNCSHVKKAPMVASGCHQEPSFFPLFLSTNLGLNFQCTVLPCGWFTPICSPKFSQEGDEKKI